MESMNVRGSSRCLSSTPLRASRLSRIVSSPWLWGAFLLAAPSSQAGALYAIGQVLDEVYLIDTATGAATLVSVLPPSEPMCGIAFDDEGVLHGTTWNSVEDMELWQLDPWASSATLVGISWDPCSEGSLAYDASTDRFYTVWQQPFGPANELLWIDPDTGVGTYVGDLGLGDLSDVSGITFLADGTLVAYDPHATLPGRLLEINKFTGAATVIGEIGDADFGSSQGGLAYDPDTDTLYMSNTVELWSIDPATGAGTLIGPHGIIDQIDGLSVLPDPCMIGTDLLSTLFNVDPASGAGTTPRTTGADRFVGLAMNDSGELYGLNAGAIPGLYTIDPPSGVAALIGSLGVPDAAGGLDFDPVSGELFGVGGASELFEINTATGTAAVVGPLVDEFGDPILLAAMAFDDVGDLFVLKAGTAPPEIYQVDPIDATVLDRVPLPGLPLDYFGGMEFDDSTGELYLSYGGLFYRANPYTGATIPIGPTPAMSALEVTGSCGLPPPRLDGFLRATPPNGVIWGGATATISPGRGPRPCCSPRRSR